MDLVDWLEMQDTGKFDSSEACLSHYSKNLSEM
jgi:hypothetical protein